MKILHTSDWHVGRTIRGRSRADEHREVLAEIVAIAGGREVDLVIVAGDLFDTAAPSPESEQIVYEALLALTRVAAKVVIIAGNHDNPARLRAVKPLLSPANVICGDYPRGAAKGGLVELSLGGTEVRIALMPFVSQRQIVRATQLMELEGLENTREYQVHVEAMLEQLAEGFRTDAVNLVVSHSAVMGGGPSGSEREAHIFDYYVPASVFPVAANYVALGHFHGCQRVPGPGLLWYSGSPLQLDFGEAGQEKQVLLVDAHPGLPATVEPVPLAAGRRLRTIEGAEDEVLVQGLAAGDDYLRATIAGPRRAGMADELRGQLPNLVEIRLAGTDPGVKHATEARADRPYTELFAEYLEERNASDKRVEALFGELLEELDAPETA